MRALTIILLVLPIFFGGCMQMEWYSPNKSVSDFNQDKYNCLQRAAQLYPVVAQEVIVRPAIQGDSTTNCITSGGWTNCTTTPGMYTPAQTRTVDVNANNRDSAFELCMNATGWVLRRKQ